MKLAVMQPYFFPYIGYWQLIHAVDTFVLLDDVQYIQGGWINRNRILKQGGGWRYILMPLRKHSMNEPIKGIRAQDGKDWKTPILKQLEHYSHKNRAPFYGDVMGLLEDIFSKITDGNVVKINEVIVNEICRYLGITTRILTSSSQEFNYENVHGAGEWSLRIAEQMNAQEYINPISGAGLFDPDQFRASEISLSFLKCGEIKYAQGAEFEPSLSIIDVLMFNGQAGTRDLLGRYSIEQPL